MRTLLSFVFTGVFSAVADPAVTAPDPRLEGWQTEAISEQLDLKSVAKMIETGEAAPAGAVFSFPAKAGNAASVGGFTVTRWTEPKSAGAGAIGLAALRQWLGATATDGGHVKWKTVRVTTAGAQTETEQIFHFHREGTEWNGEAVLTWTGDPPELRSLKLTRAEKTERTAAGALHFTDATAAVMAGCQAYGEQYLHGNTYWRNRLEKRMGYLKFGQTGLAIADVDGDGLEDLYSCQGGGLPNRLFLHQPDGTVKDATAGSGLDILDCTQTALFADLDNDGDADAVLALLGPLCIFENDGKGKFTRRALLPAVETGFGLAATDYDGDGDTDLFVCRYFASAKDGGALAKPLPAFDANNGGADVLLRNDGNFRFTDVTVAAGLDGNNRRYGYACVWDDVNNDGLPDLYVANDFGRNNLFLQSRTEDGTSRFKDAADTAGLSGGAFGMSASTGDFNRDGLPDIHLGAMWSSAGHRITRAAPFRKEEAAAQRGKYFQLARGNSLFANAGGGKFTDVSDAAGIRLGRWAWACLFADANNDGWEDLLVANGFVTGEAPDDL
jgi:hypothetical protein